MTQSHVIRAPFESNIRILVVVQLDYSGISVVLRILEESFIKHMLRST